jgi:nucleotide-binding universal stress UspA family protein
VGADGTPESLPVIEFAFAQASLRGLPLTVLHAYWDAVAAVAGLRSGSEQVPDPSDVEELRVVLSGSVAGFSEKYPDVSVSLRLQHGLVDEVLTRGQSWGLVVVGRHPMDSVWRMLTGGIATAVLERAQSTVAIVPQT